MFRGNHPTRVDEKGRLKVPAEFKRVLDEKYSSGQFYITSSGWQGCSTVSLRGVGAYRTEAGSAVDVQSDQEKVSQPGELLRAAGRY
jgi:DNA-binding transcriptional regulator/RsmH inhibitor MraZ